MPAVSRFYRAHRMSPSLGAWVSDKRESRGLSEEEESASPPPSIPLLPAFVVFEGTSSRVASLIRTRETRKNDFVRRGTMRESLHSPEISREEEITFLETIHHSRLPFILTRIPSWQPEKRVSRKRGGEIRVEGRAEEAPSSSPDC